LTDDRRRIRVERSLFRWRRSCPKAERSVRFVALGKRSRSCVGCMRKLQSQGDLGQWRRCKAILEFLEGKTVVAISEELDIGRSSVYRWLDRYEAEGARGLKTIKPPGAEPRLDEDQQAELASIIEEGPRCCWISHGRVDWPDDRRPDPEALRREVPQPSHSSPAASTGLLGAASSQKAGQSRRRSASILVANEAARNQKKAVAMRRSRDVRRRSLASGWTARFIGRGHESVCSLVLTRTEHARRPMSSALSASTRLSFAYEFSDVFNGDTFWFFLMRLVARFTPRKIFEDYRQRSLPLAARGRQSVASSQPRKD